MNSSENPICGDLLDELPQIFCEYISRYQIHKQSYIALNLNFSNQWKQKGKYVINLDCYKQYKCFSEYIKKRLARFAKYHNKNVTYYIFFEHNNRLHCHGIIYFEDCDYPIWSVEIAKLFRTMCKAWSMDIRPVSNPLGFIQYCSKDFRRFPYAPVYKY